MRVPIPPMVDANGMDNFRAVLKFLNFILLCFSSGANESSSLLIRSTSCLKFVFLENFGIHF